jgi:hypothetical protein
MKVAVIGSRSFTDYERLTQVLSGMAVTEIISGGAQGADTLAERYATTHGIPTLIFKPDWKKYGRAAGPIRNKDIINNAEVVVAFWDGKSKGTLSSIKLAEKNDKELVKVIYE